MATTKRTPGGEPEEQGLKLDEINPGGEKDLLNDDEVRQQGAAPTIVGDAAKMVGQEIPEATHKGATINIDSGSDDAKKTSGTGANEKKQGGPASPNAGGEKQEDFNSEFAQMPSDEQQQITAMTSDTIIDTILALVKKIPDLISISQDKLDDLHDKGEIDKYQLIPKNKYTSDTVTVSQYANILTEKIRPSFEIPGEDIEKIRPLAAYVLNKKGFAPSPEQLLLGLGIKVGIGVGVATIAGIIGRFGMIKELKKQRQHSQEQAQTNLAQQPIHKADQMTADGQPVHKQETQPIHKEDLANPAINEIVNRATANNANNTNESTDMGKSGPSKEGKQNDKKIYTPKSPRKGTPRKK